MMSRPPILMRMVQERPLKAMLPSPSTSPASQAMSIGETGRLSMTSPRWWARVSTRYMVPRATPYLLARPSFVVPPASQDSVIPFDRWRNPDVWHRTPPAKGFLHLGPAPPTEQRIHCHHPTGGVGAFDLCSPGLCPRPVGLGS